MEQDPRIHRCKRKPLLPLATIDIPPGPNFHPSRRPLLPPPRQDTREVIIIPALIPALVPAPPLLGPGILLLILSEHEVIAPPVFAAATDFAVAAPRHGLGDGKAVAAVRPLDVLLQVDLEVAACVGGAGHPGQGGLAAALAELEVGLLVHEETGVAA